MTTWSRSVEGLNATGAVQAPSNTADPAAIADTAARRHCLDVAIRTHSSRLSERK
ncbi:hypothetical protein Asi02nite_41220 [Asanoa siamensis]|uniref:Uncharacterized protein n=1 Tax=Asanoa siamensis TaxID=926357 RepID=A0ABQ4CTJ9_9ACTN|nr:hypothetical protein Asi02nite_41220 [Asanoa siamensis]